MCPCVTVTDGHDEVVLSRVWFLFFPPLVFLCLSLGTYGFGLPVRSVWSELVCWGSVLWTDSQLWQVFSSVVWGIMESILCKLLEIAGTLCALSPFNMWRRAACCLWEVKGYVCQYRSQSVDPCVYEYLYMPLRMHAYVHKHIFLYLMSSCPNFLSLTGVLSNLCCSPLFEVKRTSPFWTSGERYEFIIGARTARQCCMWLMLYSYSQACRWLWMNNSLFFKFFLRKTLITESAINLSAWQSASVTACCQNPPHLFSKTTLLSFSLLSRTVHTHSFLSNFLFTLPLASLAFVLRWNVSSEPLSMDLSTVSVWGRQRLHVRVNTFKRACE